MATIGHPLSDSRPWQSSRANSSMSDRVYTIDMTGGSLGWAMRRPESTICLCYEFKPIDPGVLE